MIEMLKFVVVVTGGCGTMYISEVLTQRGIPRGHEWVSSPGPSRNPHIESSSDGAATAGTWRGPASSGKGIARTQAGPRAEGRGATPPGCAAPRSRGGGPAFLGPGGGGNVLLSGGGAATVRLRRRESDG